MSLYLPAEASTWLSWELSVRLTQSLVHFLWQGCAIWLLALLANYGLCRASANLRYLVNVSALLLMLACVPLTYAVLTPREEAVATVEETGSQSTAPAPLAPAAPPAQQIGRSPSEAGTQRVDEASTGRLAPLSIRLAEATRASSPYASAAYVLGVSLMLLRLAAAIWSTARLRREARPIADSSLVAMLTRQARRMGLSGVPVIAWCGRVSTPVVVGIIRPMILLPPAVAGGLSPAQLEAVLAHELAHLARLDMLVNLLQRLAEALLFFHPAVWYVSRRISHERENCCDDRVLKVGWGRVEYADALVRMAELCAAPGGATATALHLAASGERPSQFKRRVLRLLDAEDRLRLGFSRGGILAAAGLALVCVLALSLAGRWSGGDDREAAPASGKIISTKSDDELAHKSVSFRAAPWKEVLQWYAREMNQSIEIKVAPGGNFTYESPRPLDQREIILLINSELQKRGYCLLDGVDTVLAVASSDVLARQSSDQLRKDFLHGYELRKGPDKFESYFEIVDQRAVGQMTGPGAPQGPAIAYVLAARRDFTAAELSKFLAACFGEPNFPSLQSGRPVVADGFAVLHNGKWLGVNAPALAKGERIEVWQNYCQEWNARAPADFRIVIEGQVLGADGQPRADARVRQLLVEGVSDEHRENAELASFLNWAYGGAVVVDKKGKFAVALRHHSQFVRQAWLYAVAPGHAPQRIGPIAVGYDKPSTPLTIKLKRGFAGQIKLVRPDGKPLDKGEVAVAAQDDTWGPGIPMATYPLDGKPIRVADCPAGPLLLKVRVPGLPELEIRDVQPKADEVIEIKAPLAEEQPQKPAVDEKKASVEMLLETRVALKVDDKPLIFVLDELEKAHGVSQATRALVRHLRASPQLFHSSGLAWARLIHFSAVPSSWGCSIRTRNRCSCLSLPKWMSTGTLSAVRL